MAGGFPTFPSNLADQPELAGLLGVNRFGPAATDALGAAFRGQSAVSSQFPRQLQEIKSENWNKVFRYSFFLAEADGVSGSVNRVFPNGFINKYFRKTQVDLFIPPQAINISTIFANSITATNNGVLEENSGVYFRDIQISGTTGVLPEKTVLKNAPTSFEKVSRNLFPGVTTAIGQVLDRVRNVTATLRGVDAATNPPFDELKTGFFRFWELHNFLVQYANVKKNFNSLPDGSDKLRLVFFSPKDNIGYVVTPIAFNMSRSAASPLLYNYSITMRAWDLTLSNPESDAVEVLSDVPRPDSIALISNLSNFLSNTRSVINAASNTLSGVVSDFAGIMNLYTSSLMVLKDTSDVALQVIDFPHIIRNQAAVLLGGSTNALVRKLREFNRSSDVRRGSIPFNSVDEKESNFASAATKSSITAAGGDTNRVNAKLTPAGETKLDPRSTLQVQAVGVLEEFIDDPEAQQTLIDELDFPDQVLDDIEEARQETLQSTTSSSVRQLANNLQEMSDNFAQQLNMMDATYAQIFGLPAPLGDTGRQPNEDDIILQASLQEAKHGFISTLATGQIFQEREFDPFATANQNLPDTDQLSSPTSAVAVAYSRGSTLEQMAQQYLGNANRAREIALLNNLRPPFIDEAGFTKAIQNANGRQFVVEEETRLTINQSITLKGTGVPSTRRRIINIVEISETQKRITVNGPDNLAIFTPATNPFLEARLPGTIGSGDTILIPSAGEPEEALATRNTPLFDRLSQAERVFKVDIALDERNARDMVVSPNGDVQRSYGYDNAVQAIRLKVEIEQGELEQHPEEGLAIPLGFRNSDVALDDIIEAMKTRIQTDPRFIDADVNIEIEGSVSRATVRASGAQGTGQVAVDFEVGKV